MKTEASKSRNVTRRQLLDVSARLFHWKGFRGTSMQDIASDLGIKKGSIYYYISSKDELLLDIARAAMKLLIDAGEKAAFSTLPPEEKLRELIRSHVRLTCEHPDLFAVTLHDLTPANASSFWNEAVKLRDRYESLLRGIIRAGKQTGAFREVDEKLAGFALLGMINWLIRWYDPGGPRSPDIIADLWSDLFLNGLGAPQPDEEPLEKESEGRIRAARDK
ncbi:MAG: TetR/AcrR family transcriptional regulator [Deltaproteobacteria bacterium]|nr:TetR/AcrR family transcriptional regulator [Deltaproteobacteria bacterium]